MLSFLQAPHKSNTVNFKPIQLHATEMCSYICARALISWKREDLLCATKPQHRETKRLPYLLYPLCPQNPASLTIQASLWSIHWQASLSPESDLCGGKPRRQLSTFVGSFVAPFTRMAQVPQVPIPLQFSHWLFPLCGLKPFLIIALRRFSPFAITNFLSL